MSEFSDRPFVAGSVVGLRAFNVDSLGRLVGPSYGGIFTPGENVAECKKDAGGYRIQFMPSSMDYDLIFGSRGEPIMRPKKKPEKKPEPKPHSLAGVDCTCGFYAYYDGRNDYKEWNRISAVIEGYGVCTVGSRGFRASKARLLALIVPGKRFPEPRFRLVERNYPDVPMYARKRDALAAHPLSQGEVPTPDEPDFWTRSAS